MAWTATTNRFGVAVSKVADQASITSAVVAGGNMVAGSVTIITVVVDNHATVDGDEGAVVSVTDTKGNTYFKAAEFANGNGAAQTGVTVSVWFSLLTTTLVLGADTCTATFSNSSSRDASCITNRNFTITAGNRVSVSQVQTVADDATDPSAQTIAGLISNEYLFYHMLGAEAPTTDTYTLTAGYTDATNIGTSGGAADSNVQLRGEFRILTGTGDTVNIASVTADRDYAQVYIAFLESPVPSKRTLVGVGL